MDNKSETVKFKDERFKEIISNILKIKNQEIYVQDMKKIQSIDSEGISLSDISGIDHCSNLKYLNLSSYMEKGNITDITPLQYLDNLTELNLSNNLIRDISALKNLKNLQILDLSMNPIDDLSVLSELVELTEVNFNSGRIELSEILNINICTQEELETLLFHHYNKEPDFDKCREIHQKLKANNIMLKDISPLKGLKKLKTLRLINNDIHDISPLSDLRNLDFLILTGNPVDDFSPVSYVKKVVK